jgi:hypothetical protein
MKSAKYITAAAVAALIVSLLYTVYAGRELVGDVRSYLDGVYRIERDFIESIPIYEDYATPRMEQALRRYLLHDHLRVADRCGVSPVMHESEIAALARAGALTKLSSGADQLYYFYNVREKYRYLTPRAARGLEKLVLRFQENLNRKRSLPPVKIAISSVLRPVSYQRDLRGRNINATIVSTHSRGTSFDIFYDDYYISLPSRSSWISGAVLTELRRRFGFLLGDALRRQLRSVLMETLLQLQEEGSLYVTLERRQRCYHVTVLPDENR